jgi:RNA polymerase sigma-70 factor (ECF subfamily)
VCGPPTPARAGFATTGWSLGAAAGAADGAEGRAALESLCRDCWFPLYAFARRGGASAEDAQDLVQGFFASLLEKDWLRQADPARGRFRTFLLAAFRHHASKERDRASAAKRGGGVPALSLDFEGAESRWTEAEAGARTPEAEYERRWALSLLDRALDGVRASYGEGERGVVFETLRPFLVAGTPGPDLAAAAATLGTSEGAARVALHRLRTRYRDLLRATVAETVVDPSEVDDELRHLVSALSA